MTIYKGLSGSARVLLLMCAYFCIYRQFDDVPSVCVYAFTLTLSQIMRSLCVCVFTFTVKKVIQSTIYPDRPKWILVDLVHTNGPL